MNSYLLILGVAAIPFGFIVYQVYYWMYWHAPVPRIIFQRLMNASDRSKGILKDISGYIEWEKIFCRPLKVPPETAYKEGFFGLKDIDVMRKYQHNWALAQSLWYFALCNERYAPVANILEKRFQFLNDIYHSLGACIIALNGTYFVYLLTYEVRMVLHDGLLFSRGMAAALNLILVIAMIFIFRRGRRDSFYALTMLMHDIIGVGISSESTIQELETTLCKEQPSANTFQ
jgi:hypothetical protein